MTQCLQQRLVHFRKVRPMVNFLEVGIEGQLSGSVHQRHDAALPGTWPGGLSCQCFDDSTEWVGSISVQSIRILILFTEVESPMCGCCRSTKWDSCQAPPRHTWSRHLLVQCSHWWSRRWYQQWHPAHLSPAPSPRSSDPCASPSSQHPRPPPSHTRSDSLEHHFYQQSQLKYF